MERKLKETFVLDTCAFINLCCLDIQEDENEEYEWDVGYLKILNETIHIYFSQEVIKEIDNNLRKYKKDIRKLTKLFNYKKLQNNELLKDDKDIFVNKIDKILSYGKKNGELDSIGLIYFLNRNNENRYFSFHFVTDDTKAKEDFDKFVNINLLGNIINSIQFLLILVIENKISLTKLKRYIRDLKISYVKEFNKLNDECKKLHKEINNPKEQSYISMIQEIIENINKNDINNYIDKINDIKTRSSNSNVKKLIKKAEEVIKKFENNSKISEIERIENKIDKYFLPFENIIE